LNKGVLQAVEIDAFYLSDKILNLKKLVQNELLIFSDWVFANFNQGWAEIDICIISRNLECKLPLFQTEKQQK
jgi:hypothetical protein